MMAQLADIANALASPFAIEEIELLPKGKFERDGKTLCMAMPYADPRCYQDRLNKLAYGQWETPAPIALIAGNKLVCYVTVVICGIAHTDVGEAFLASGTREEENTATEAWAQGFKRACSHFGLGRYLYDLEKAWTPYNVQRKQIDLDEAGKQNVVRVMYQKAGLLKGATQPQAPSASQSSGNGKSSSAPPNGAPSPVQAQNEAIAKPSEVEKLKSDFGLAYGIIWQKLDAAWERFKQEKLKRLVSDPDMTVGDCEALCDIVKRKQESMQSASV
jgi:hypothetical protein